MLTIALHLLRSNSSFAHWTPGRWTGSPGPIFLISGRFAWAKSSRWRASVRTPSGEIGALFVLAECLT